MAWAGPLLLLELLLWQGLDRMLWQLLLLELPLELLLDRTGLVLLELVL